VLELRLDITGKGKQRQVAPPGLTEKKKYISNNKSANREFEFDFVNSASLVAHWLIRTRTRTNTNPKDTEANAAGRSGNVRALRKQSKCGMIEEGAGHWPTSSENLQKAMYLWALRTLQNNKEEGARAGST
jgi:hypothetical protein